MLSSNTRPSSFVCLPGIPSSTPWPTGGAPCTPFHSSVHAVGALHPPTTFLSDSAVAAPFYIRPKFLCCNFVTALQNLAKFHISGCSGDSFSKTAYVYQLWTSTPGPYFGLGGFFLFFSCFLLCYRVGPSSVSPTLVCSYGFTTSSPLLYILS